MMPDSFYFTKVPIEENGQQKEIALMMQSFIVWSG